jgi:hypothetical protein
MFQVDIVERWNATTTQFFLVKDFLKMLTYITDYFKTYPSRIRIKII